MNTMLLLSKNKKKRAMTLTEILIAISILAIVFTIVGRWFTLNRQYQKRITKQFDCDALIRSALWEMHKDLKSAHTILYPRVDSIDPDNNKNIISDTKLVFRNFQGDIVSYFYDKSAKKVTRQITYIPTTNAPSDEQKIIGKDLDCVIFTNKALSNNLVGIYMEAGPSVQVDSVYLMND